LKLDIVYEDNHLIAINKPSGVLVQGDKTGDLPLAEHVKAYIKKKYNKPGDVYLGIPHRIDRPTSGLIIFTKTSKALTRMNALFKNREIQKVYWAVVKNKPDMETGVLKNYLLKNQQKNKSFVTKDEKRGLESILTFRISAKSDLYYLLEVKPKTGRHHQIRVQLSHMGCPIKGDVKYGFDRANKDKSIHLHARSVHFLHPIKKEKVELVARVPHEPLWQFFVK
jgi:23S rRNA pseudouridine1911/1915/1917 synthase